MPKHLLPEPGSTVKRDKVLRQHPEYRMRNAFYRFAFDSFKGLGGYMPFLGAYTGAKTWIPDDQHKTGDEKGRWVWGGGSRNARLYTYLRPHKRESSLKFRDRWEVAYYPNYIEWIVKTHSGLLTRHPPGRIKYPDTVTGWMASEDWDIQLKSEIVPWGLAYGRHYTLVNRRLIEDDRQEGDVEMGGDLFTRLIHPSNVIDWLEEDGELTAVKYKVEHDPTSDLMDPMDPVDRVWVINREGWFFFDVPKKSGVGNTDIKVGGVGAWDGAMEGVNPVVQYVRGDDGQSAIYFLAQIMRRLFNVLSLKTEIEDLGTFPILYIPMETDDAARLRKILLGSGVGIGVPSDANMVPGYATYDMGPHQTMSDEQERLINMMRRLAALTIGGQQQGAAKTGIASAYEFMLTGARLLDEIPAFEQYELQVADRVDRWENGKGVPDDATASWSRRFDLVEKKEAIATIDVVMGMEPGDLAAAALKKKAVRTALGADVTEAQLSDIEEEIDTLDNQAQADATEPPAGDPFAGLPEANISAR